MGGRGGRGYSQSVAEGRVAHPTLGRLRASIGEGQVGQVVAMAHGGDPSLCSIGGEPPYGRVGVWGGGFW